MKHLKLFNNHTEYETFTQSADYVLPNVSYDKEHVHYNPDVYNGHPYVEIGGLKWATMNIGATTETDTGLYFQWGDTQGYTAEQMGTGEGQKPFQWGDYKYGDGTNDHTPGDGILTKYNMDFDHKSVLDPEDDAAIANWGGLWRMPSVEDFYTLSEAVNAVWTTNYKNSGINGLLCTDKNDSSKTIFFPASGNLNWNRKLNVGTSGYCWSTDRNGYQTGLQSYVLQFSAESITWGLSVWRYIGFPIRPVAS